MKSLFVVNPQSGVRRRVDIADTIRTGCASWAASWEITRCETTGELDGIIEMAAANGVDVVFAVGGDGTVHEVARRLAGTSMALGIVPAGSGNGLARHLGIPLDTRRALSACRDGVVVTIDSATVNGVPWFGVMGVGLDALIAERFTSSKVRGLRTYVGLGLRAFIGFHAEEYEIEIDGTSQKRRAQILAIANSSQYGNNARIAPLASLQDGLLDVVVIEEASLLGAPLLLMRLFNGTLHRSHGVRIQQGRHVRVRRAAAGPAHIDGEAVTLPAELDVRIRPASLRVLLPRKSTRI